MGQDKNVVVAAVILRPPAMVLFADCFLRTVRMKPEAKFASVISAGGSKQETLMIILAAMTSASTVAIRMSQVVSGE